MWEGARHVALVAKKRIAYNILFGRPRGERQFVRARL
jgi:hypothetical protein